MWEPSFCSRSPIALGYTRGHFCALVPPEPTTNHNLDISALNQGGGATSNDAQGKCSYLPLMSYDQKVLPIHFLGEADGLGQEEAVLRRWLDVGVTSRGLWVAQMRIQKPPLLVAQMTEEWLNHYRKQA